MSSINLNTEKEKMSLLCNNYLQDTIIKSFQQWEKLFIPNVHSLRIEASRGLKSGNR